MEERLDFYINKISSDKIKAFVELALEEHSNKSKKKIAVKAMDYLWKKFEYRNLINDNEMNLAFIDVTVAAVLIHNLFYKNTDISTILAHRVKLKEIIELTEIDESSIRYIYEMIEAQLGENHPIQKLKPNQGPQSDFADAVWYANNF